MHRKSINYNDALQWWNVNNLTHVGYTPWWEYLENQLAAQKYEGPWIANIPQPVICRLLRWIESFGFIFYINSQSAWTFADIHCDSTLYVKQSNQHHPLTLQKLFNNAQHPYDRLLNLLKFKNPTQKFPSALKSQTIERRLLSWK